MLTGFPISFQLKIFFGQLDIIQKLNVEPQSLTTL